LAPGNEHPALEALQARLRDEEAAYGEVLAALDRLAAFPLPAEDAPDVREKLARLNELWAAPERPAFGGIGGAVQRRAWDALAPARERQAEFNATLVQLLNAHLAPVERLHAHLREMASALVRYAQRLQPLVDAGDRAASALATTRSELVLEAFDRRLESLGRRLEGLLALRDRLETVGEEVHALRGTLEHPPEPPVAHAAERAARDAVYTAFENRFRGSQDEIRARLEEYAEHFRTRPPVVDLGCGRGEFLEALRAEGLESHGVESNANAVRECREKGLEVSEGDLLDHLRGLPEGSLGGVFASQVVEHLVPAVLSALLAEARRVLRPDGLLLLETVNTRSVVGLLEVFHRDPTHERPLHPDTLSFLAAAAGFTDVRVELRSPVPPDARLQPVPADGLPERAANALNENVERLNAVVFGPMDYALFARR
jgi:O-antigen chain-terminating methyltransferase